MAEEEPTIQEPELQQPVGQGPDDQEEEVQAVLHPAPAGLVQLEHSRLSFPRGQVFAGIKKKYPKHVRAIRKIVPLSKRIKRDLEGIAREVEHNSTSRGDMVARHPDWMETIDEAMKEIRQEFKKIQKSKKDLLLEKNKKVFERTIVVDTAERTAQAEQACKKMENFEDLKTYRID